MIIHNFKNEYHIHWHPYMCQYCVLISNSSPLDTHVAASSRLGIVFPPIREYLLGQAFCTRPSPWKGREGSQCAAPTLIPLACPPPPGLPTHINQYSPDLTGGHFCLHLLGHSLGAKYLESIFFWGESERTLYSIYICV